VEGKEGHKRGEDSPVHRIRKREDGDREERGTGMHGKSGNSLSQGENRASNIHSSLNFIQGQRKRKKKGKRWRGRSP